MSAYLAKLKNIDDDNFANSPHTEPTKPTQPPFTTPFDGFDGFVGDPPPLILKNNSSTEGISNWWLVTLEGLEPAQVAIWPPSTYVEVLKLNPKAISATPMQSPHMQAVAIDTPQALLDLMRSGGYSLSVNGDDLHIDQAHWIDEELVGLITIHKTGLIKILESEVMQI